MVLQTGTTRLGVLAQIIGLSFSLLGVPFNALIRHNKCACTETAKPAQNFVHATIGKVDLGRLAQREDWLEPLRNDALAHEGVDCDTARGPNAACRDRKRWGSSLAKIEDAANLRGGR